METERTYRRSRECVSEDGWVAKEHGKDFRVSPCVRFRVRQEAKEKAAIHAGQQALPKHRSRLMSVTFSVTLFLGATAILFGSTSPLFSSADPNQIQPASQENALITFSEFPVGTYITDQYAYLGIVFGGDNPFIATDGANPTSPVLSGSPRFEGVIEGYFVNPYDGVTPATVSWFLFDAGYFDEIETTRIEWFDRNGIKLGEVLNSQLGIETFLIEDVGIAFWRIGMITSDTAGYAIDNVSFGDPSLLYLIKFDDVDENDCLSPEQELTYTICFDNAYGLSLTDAYIIDWLPEGVSYPPGTWSYELGDPNDPNEPPFYLIPPDPGYDPETHSYVWPLGDIDPNTWGCVDLTVVVNDKAVPGGILHNVAELWGTLRMPDPNDPNLLNPETFLIARATLDTDVCCYAGIAEILYVDQSATNGGNTGLNWQNAFLELRDALDYARSSLCAQVHSIYVAQGPYYPGDNTWDTFEIPDGVAVYGGFPKGGGDFWQRNPRRFNTILNGRIDDTTRNETVVRMGHETLLDGFTVTEAGPYPFGQGIYASGADFAVTHCRIENNENYGLYAEDGNVSVSWCTIRNNKADGIRHIGEGFALIVENCWIRQSGRYGIACEDSTPFAINSVVSESDMAMEGRAGIYLVNPTNQPIMQNLTVAHNKAAGIALFGSMLPEIQNSIVFHNGGDALAGFSADEAVWYSCIEDANSVNYNINIDPQFAYFDPNNVRLSPESLCLNASNPYLDYSSQLDMDGNPRVYGAAPDMGAYELICDINVSNEWDLNADGVINLYEFNFFSRAWLAHDPNDPAWLADAELADPNLSEGWYEWKHKFDLDATGDSTYSVDLADLLMFLEDAPWLWVACWRTDLQPEMMMSGFDSGSMRLAGFESQSLEKQTTQEITSQEQLFDLASMIVQLENLWLTEADIRQKVDADDWQRFVEEVYQNLYNLATEVCDKK